MVQLIGEGSYGCVFKPHLRCEGERSTSKSKVPKNTIGKVFPIRYAFDEEYEQMRVIDKLDPKGEFSVPLYGSCTVSNRRDVREKLDKCRLLMRKQQSSQWKSPSGYEQLVYANGGNSLDNLIENNVGSVSKLKRIFLALRPSMSGISKLHKAGYIHQDIKPANMLISNKSKLSIIDYGLMEKTKNIFVSSNYKGLEYDYLYYPPEFKLFAYKSSLSKFYYAAIRNYDYGYFKDIVEDILGINLKDELISMFSDKKKEKMYDTAKVDVYSLGIVILELYVWSGLYAKKCKINTSNYDFKNNIEMLLRKMIAIHPHKRASIAQAINLYDKIVRKM